jgi:glycosyltransferase involved in cell wall biosynthesis
MERIFPGFSGRKRPISAKPERGNLIVSVVTVVRNDVSGLERTMDSVAAQDYAAVEYIVVDGASTDGTTDIVRRRAGELARWVSEPDGGIYQAMNKGARLTSGSYVCFLNAGDRFASAEAISQMFLPPPTAELLWGDCIIEKARGEEYDCARSVLKTLHRQMTVSHQSLFVQRPALLARPFDESFTIAADYDFLCERLLAGATWDYRPFPVSRINDRGASAQLFGTSIREKMRVSLARFPAKRASILLYYSILWLYMNAKKIWVGRNAR